MEDLTGEVTIRTQDEALPQGGASTGHTVAFARYLVCCHRGSRELRAGAQLKGQPVTVCARTSGAATRAAGGAVIAAILTFQKNLKTGILFRKKEIPLVLNIDST